MLVVANADGHWSLIIFTECSGVQVHAGRSGVKFFQS